MSNHLANITTAGMFYVSLHWAAEKLLIPRFDPRIVARLSGGERIDLAEKVCSTTNGLFSGLLAIYLVYVRRDFSGDIIYPYPSRPLDLLFAGFAGYSLYDLGTMALKPRASKDGPLMWMHHLAAFFPTAFMVTELTVVPANLVCWPHHLQCDYSEPAEYEMDSDYVS
ncbi:hypothetical protein BJ085DRAFT_27318 [Dimargaris cristalligena]|uniref:TLC domain-containing protein n=1 Tax=Dimargaris cristalligena TaxID=215637 RepID=A0A4P9ZNH2_9FUNG|nr:hypothetical protein BJ085DRAFT_27318 [Dimargaris cristalligena]|eukprot:RKP34151.1 hypothetical protein BJ085DRAFT_27318 [Dimargaris cristalligena]